MFAALYAHIDMATDILLVDWDHTLRNVAEDQNRYILDPHVHQRSI